MKPNQISWAGELILRFLVPCSIAAVTAIEWRFGEAQGASFTKNLPKDDDGEEKEEELSIPMETTREFCSLGTF